MSLTLDALRDSLVRQHGLGLGGGLVEADADTLVRAIDSGAPFGDVAGLVNLDERVTRSITVSGVADTPSVLGRLLPTMSTVESTARDLRAAGIYPLVLAASVLFAGVVVGGIGMPAVSQIPGAPADSGLGVTLAAVLAAILLVLLSVGVLSRARLPLLRPV